MKLADCKPGTEVYVACGQGNYTSRAKIVSMAGPIATVLTDSALAYRAHHCRLRPIEGQAIQGEGERR